VQCADDIVLLANEGKVLQGMIDALIEIEDVKEWKCGEN